MSNIKSVLMSACGLLLVPGAAHAAGGGGIFETIGGLIIIVLGVGYVIMIQLHKINTRKEYEDALAGDDVQAANSAGQRFYSTARMDWLGRGGGLYEVDHAAIRNDISSMQASRHRTVEIVNEEPTDSNSSSGEDTIAKLERLHKLKEIGAISAAEYDAQKARLL